MYVCKFQFFIFVLGFSIITLNVQCSSTMMPASSSMPLSGVSDKVADTPSAPTIFGFSTCPPFELERPRFPQETFFGRYLHYLDVINPRALFVSKEKVDASLALLDNYARDPAATRGAGTTDKQLWRAQKIKQAIFHPDTGERIPAPFRMSGFLAFGWIPTTGMLLPNPSWPTLLFWQWANQSHNACVNYANRNASKPQPVQVYLKAYAAAVTAAIGTSAGLTWIVKQSANISAAKKLIIQRFVPLPAVSLASTLNVLFMRAPEISSGIDVFDDSGVRVGTSKVAAKQAVINTAMTRAFLPVPLLLIPPCVMPLLEKTRFVRRGPATHLFANAVVCTLSFAFTLPVALALFPQVCKIERSRLEPELQKSTQQSILYYNRGM